MGNCFGTGPSTNPGAVLDRVISQASSDDDCLLYKLANYKKRGELVEAYNIGGALEVEKLIRDQFGILMYKDGKGQVISRTEYLRWKFRNLKQVVIPVESSSGTDPLGKWEDHETCWQMQYRGSLGETLLHVLIICDTRLHTRLARILLKCFPKLAIDVVEGEEYLGASSLHLAIAYNNNDLVHLLVECGSKIEQRAIGSFFLPRDQQRLKPAKVTDYEGLAYLGEYPLSWAACVGAESVYNLLLDEGANPDLQDSFGNMILHMVVIKDQLGMFGYALRHPKIVASDGILNYNGLTPLTLACRLGRANLFREMLELSCREFWRYSNITCSAYPLNALDTIMPDGRTNWNSALFMILAGSKEEHLDMLDGGIIQRLLEEKWKTFAQRQFIKRLCLAFFHLVTMSVSIYMRPINRPNEKPLALYDDWKSYIRLGFEIASVFGSILYLVQQGGEIKNQGFISFVKQLRQAPPKAVSIVSNFLILGCIPFRVMGDVHTEEIFLSFAMVGAWFFMMFFAGAIQLTGPFVTMVYSMITGDMLTFGIIFLIFLLGFSQAFYFLFKSHPLVPATLFDAYHTTWMALYQMTLGTYDYSKLSETGYPNLSKAVFIIFMIMVPILLLNMLIAMMGNTYSQVIERSEKERIKQWAKIVVSLERSVTQEDAKKYINEYSIKLGGTDPSNEIRGVMVIKSKSKTRANQRKGAVSNWKRVGKVTIQALKKRGMTGEEMRQLMWGHRNSISTPQNITPRQSMEVDVSHLMPNSAGIDAGVGAPGNFLGAGMDATLDKLSFSSIDSTHGPGPPNPDTQSGTLASNLPAKTALSLSPVASQNHQQLGNSVTPMTTPISSPTLLIPSTSAVVPNVSGQNTAVRSSTALTPTSPTPTPITPTPIVTNHITPDIEKTPIKSTKSNQQTRRRNIKFGLRPKIVIFSDEKDLIRVTLDSDETDDESDDQYEQYDLLQPTAASMTLKRRSIAGTSGGQNGRNNDTDPTERVTPPKRSISTSRDDGGSDPTTEEENSKTTKNENIQKVGKSPTISVSSTRSPNEKNSEDGGGAFNFAFEPEEFAAAEKMIPRVSLSSGVILLPESFMEPPVPPVPLELGTGSKEESKSRRNKTDSSNEYYSTDNNIVVSRPKTAAASKSKSRTKSARTKASSRSIQPKKSSSSTEALISENSSSSPPPDELPSSSLSQSHQTDELRSPPEPAEDQKSSVSSSTEGKAKKQQQKHSIKSRKSTESKIWKDSDDPHHSEQTGREKKAKTVTLLDPTLDSANEETGIEEESRKKEIKSKKQKHHGRSKSAKSSNKVEPSASSGSTITNLEDDIMEEAENKPRPTTANDRWSTKDISNMNKLVAWDRPEDEI